MTDREVIFVCSDCGRRSRDRFGEDAINDGWNAACVLNAVRCYADAVTLDAEGYATEIDDAAILPHDDTPPPPGQPLRVIFGPGCFDGFEGTPEELASLQAEIERMAATGEIQALSRPMSDADWAEVQEEQREREERLRAQGGSPERQ